MYALGAKYFDRFQLLVFIKKFSFKVTLLDICKGIMRSLNMSKNGRNNIVGYDIFFKIIFVLPLLLIKIFRYCFL